MEFGLEITCNEVRAMRDAGDDFVLLDCRESVEHGIATLSDSTLLPMSELPERISELTNYRARRIVVICHRGFRSLQAAVWLRQQGFRQAHSMAGGIDQWSLEIDPTVPRY